MREHDTPAVTDHVDYLGAKRRDASQVLQTDGILRGVDEDRLASELDYRLDEDLVSPNDALECPATRGRKADERVAAQLHRPGSVPVANDSVGQRGSGNSKARLRPNVGRIEGDAPLANPGHQPLPESASADGLSARA